MGTTALTPRQARASCHSMPDIPELPDIEALAAALGIPLRPEWHDAIRQNLAITLRLGALFAERPVPDELELAPVFRA